MIPTILSKVLEELQKEKPDLSYIRGMVEVLLAQEQKPVILPTPAYIPLGVQSYPTGTPTAFNNLSDPEAANLDMIARANLALVQKGTSTE